MKYTRKDLNPTKIRLSVVCDEKDLAEVRPLTVAKLSKNVKVPGFRAGKVPAGVAEKHIDPVSLESQLVEDSVNKFVIEVIDREDVRPLDRPQVEVGAFEPREKLEFTAEVEILPIIKLGNYKKLKAKAQKVDIADAEINEVIERMRTGMAEKKEVDRPAKDSDEVWIDFAGTDKEGKAVAGASGKDYPLRLGSDTFIPGFEKGLAGKKQGAEFDLPLTFPKDYHHKPLAGSKVNFFIKVNKVNEVTLPKVDDDFAAKAGPFKTVKELKSDIKRELLARKEQDAANEVKDSLVEQLVKSSDIPVPEVLIEDQVNNLERDTAQNLSYRGQTFDQFLAEQNLTRDEWRKGEAKDTAIRRVQVGLALAELSKIEQITISRDELDGRLNEMLKQYNDPNIRSQLDTPEARRDLANRMLTEKTVDRLVELNT
jgi:trigger factor